MNVYLYVIEIYTLLRKDKREAVKTRLASKSFSDGEGTGRVVLDNKGSTKN
jgi:hypothetical protein